MVAPDCMPKRLARLACWPFCFLGGDAWRAGPTRQRLRHSACWVPLLTFRSCSACRGHRRDAGCYLYLFGVWTRTVVLYAVWDRAAGR